MCVALVSEPLVSSDSSSAASPTPTGPSSTASPSASASAPAAASTEPTPTHTPATASLANVDDDLYARLYGRFRVHAPRVRLLAEQLEARASGVSGGFVAATQRGGGGGGPGEDMTGASRQPTVPATPATARSTVSRATLHATRSATSSAQYSYLWSFVSFCKCLNIVKYYIYFRLIPTTCVCTTVQLLGSSARDLLALRAAPRAASAANSGGSSATAAGKARARSLCLCKHVFDRTRAHCAYLLVIHLENLIYSYCTLYSVRME